MKRTSMIKSLLAGVLCVVMVCTVAGCAASPLAPFTDILEKKISEANQEELYAPADTDNDDDVDDYSKYEEEFIGEDPSMSRSGLRDKDGNPTSCWDDAVYDLSTDGEAIIMRFQNNKVAESPCFISDVFTTADLVQNNLESIYSLPYNKTVIDATMENTVWDYKYEGENHGTIYIAGALQVGNINKLADYAGHDPSFDTNNDELYATLTIGVTQIDDNALRFTLESLEVAELNGNVTEYTKLYAEAEYVEMIIWTKVQDGTIGWDDLDEYYDSLDYCMDHF